MFWCSRVGDGGSRSSVKCLLSSEELLKKLFFLSCLKPGIRSAACHQN